MKYMMTMDYKGNFDFTYKQRSVSQRDIETRLSNEPELLSKDEVSKVKLSTLSKHLGTKLSSRRIIDAYLRWLEVHRTGHSISKQPSWETIQRQWIAAVKSRGFGERELIEEFRRHGSLGYVPGGKSAMTQNLIHKVFREDTGKQPHPVPQLGTDRPNTKSEPTERKTDRQHHPVPQFGTDRLNTPSRPMEKNSIKRSASPWDEDNDDQGHYESRPYKYFKVSHGWKSKQTADGSPPLDFVCNRCHTKGHWLGDCPTNLDEAYDRKPEADYCCKGCNKNDHYWTLCPQNIHYDSLFQLRDRAKSKTVEKERQRQQDIATAFGVPSRIKHQKVKRLRFEDVDMITDDTEKISETGFQIDNTFNFSNDFGNTHFESESRLSLTNSSSLRKETEQFLQKQKLGTNDTVDLYSNVWNRLPREVEQRFEYTKAYYDADTDLADPSKPKLSVKEEEEDFPEEMQLDEYQWNEMQSSQVYTPRVLYLINKGSLSTEIINKRARRPTALELWDRDDNERAQVKLELQLEMERNKGQDLTEGDVTFNDPDEQYRSMPPLDTSEPQVLHVAPLDPNVSETEVRDIFKGYQITAVSVWKPKFTHDDSTISAFVSLSAQSTQDSYQYCQDLSGGFSRGYQVRVTRVNNKDTFRKAILNFQNDAEGNREWQMYHEYEQHHEEPNQLLQHLRITAAFKLFNDRGAQRVLPYRFRGFVPSLSDLVYERKDREESNAPSESDATIEDRIM